MASELLRILTSEDREVRDRSLDSVCNALGLPELLEACAELDAFRRACGNLYQRVRALFFLYAIHRFHLPARTELPSGGPIRADAAGWLLEREFERALDALLEEQRARGPSDGVSSGLAAAYRQLGFQTLADQVKRSVRTHPGNAWMFEVDRAEAHPLRLRQDLAEARGVTLCERTPVRMDLTHSAWSDIFFLGMDYPEGARVLNVSIELAVRGRDVAPQPPVEARLSVLDEPVLRLTSVDLDCTADIHELSEVFDYARDYLGLLKAAVISSGLVPPALEGSDVRLVDLLERVVGPGKGLALESCVRGIPKGSRLAVSTTLLAALIAVLMRATGQTHALAGPLSEEERRRVAARAILGEWLAGSGGGWQDSGGLWPGIKLIEGAVAEEGDPEFGVSRGRLLPTHRILGEDEVPEATRRALARSLVLVHGGMAQDVGPILEMVTERYLLRSDAEWQARAETRPILADLLDALARGDLAAVGRATTRNFQGPIQRIVPWATNPFTEALIERAQREFGARFWGFWMLGGMSGGGMGFLFDPERRDAAAAAMQRILAETKRDHEAAVPFAMEPVVYDFEISETGSMARLERAEAASSEAAARAAVAAPASGCTPDPAALEELLGDVGFDADEHEETRALLRAGDIGLACNRLPLDTRIEDVRPEDLVDARHGLPRSLTERGRAALRAGEVAVVTLAGGSGSRWSGGGGTVKALAPVARLAGRHRSFLEIALARSARTGRDHGTLPPHVVTTSYLTHAPIEAFLARVAEPGGAAARAPYTSRGGSVGLRFVPTERDLRFAWEEMPMQQLDEQAQKVRASLQAALIRWARDAGEASDYRDNLAHQCVHPQGHAFEMPGLLLGGTLARVLEDRPQLRTLLLHNVDTLGADLDPALLGLHLESENALTFEVVPRRIEDTGGGLARVDGRARLVESLALPREEDALGLSYYNSMTTWIDLDAWLAALELDRDALHDGPRVARAVRGFMRRLPAYVTLKDVKRRWGHGHEDAFPVAQVEKLWSDVTLVPELACGFVAVPRFRGQQLKEPAQLDGWLRDGSAAYVERLCGW